MTLKYAEAESTGGSWKLPHNDVWNIPSKDVGGDVHLETTYSDGPFHTITKLSGLVISCEFYDRCPTRSRKHRVYGHRSLTNLRESGYQMEGQVSLGGKKYSAFTSSQLFEREDGSLVDVGVIFVRMSDPVNKKE